jgi:glycosyltransferase involved in cell wall biosynthesis
VVKHKRIVKILKSIMNKTLSLCIITKNAENDLKNCLNSIKDLVNEIILVDTGSTDNTKKIASDFKSKIYDYNWQESFSEARNFALSKVQTDWVLILDSDEVLVGEHSNIIEIINKDYKDKIPMFFC